LLIIIATGFERGVAGRGKGFLEIINL